MNPWSTLLHENRAVSASPAERFTSESAQQTTAPAQQDRLRRSCLFLVHFLQRRLLLHQLRIRTEAFDDEHKMRPDESRKSLWGRTACGCCRSRFSEILHLRQSTLLEGKEDRNAPGCCEQKPDDGPRQRRLLDWLAIGEAKDRPYVNDSQPLKQPEPAKQQADHTDDKNYLLHVVRSAVAIWGGRGPQNFAGETTYADGKCSEEG